MDEFKQPDGVIDVRLDKVTNRLSNASCPDAYSVAFIAGTEPTDTCDQQAHQGFFQKLFGVNTPANPTPPPGANKPAASVAVQPAAPADPNAQAQNNPPEEQKKKKGLFGKIVGVFKGDDNNKSQ
jgi:penicillin-binding protein 1B